MRAGELPLEIIRMKAKGCDVDLSHNKPGFTLPSNIGELGDDIVELDLSECLLQGITCCAQHPFSVASSEMRSHTQGRCRNRCRRRSRSSFWAVDQMKRTSFNAESRRSGAPSRTSKS